ncbi:MAG TPA: hypothetical protein VFJ85_07990 [Acidimicrobiales bacterium]|nr:hypothetical protein [Acidimicrobiales bacterium]
MDRLLWVAMEAGIDDDLVALAVFRPRWLDRHHGGGLVQIAWNLARQLQLRGFAEFVLLAVTESDVHAVKLGRYGWYPKQRRWSLPRAQVTARQVETALDLAVPFRQGPVRLLPVPGGDAGASTVMALLTARA